MDLLRTCTVLGLLAACSALKSWEIPEGNLLDYVNADLTADWSFFKRTYNRTYPDSYEELRRRVIWEDTRKFIDDHNRKYKRGEATYFVGENDFADLAEDEFEKIYLSGLIVPEHLKHINETYEAELERKGRGFNYPHVSDLSSKDWRRSQKVSAVRNQGSCGSCWAFASIAAIESAYAIKHNRGTNDLSEQNLLDCSTRGNYGCRGGWMTNAYKYIVGAGGVDNESCYPYRFRQGYCYFKRNCIGSTMTGYTEVSPKTENTLMSIVARQGPVAIAVDVSGRGFMQYRGGVFSNPRCNSRQPNHAMTNVGFGTYRGYDYWLIKNSWGTRWGDGGYVKMTRNRGNQCGMASFAVIPEVK